MYDFETVSQAIPRVKNMSTYEQVPYQYSIHVILDKDNFDFKSGKNIIHLE
jgi:predicted DNA binding CopG/RHH family protein